MWVDYFALELTLSLSSPSCYRDLTNIVDFPLLPLASSFDALGKKCQEEEVRSESARPHLNQLRRTNGASHCWIVDVTRFQQCCPHCSVCKQEHWVVMTVEIQVGMTWMRSKKTVFFGNHFSELLPPPVNKRGAEDKVLKWTVSESLFIFKGRRNNNINN